MTVADAWSYESYKKDPKTKYLEDNNVLDITKEELQKMKANIDLTKKTDLDTQLKDFNELVDQDFDGWMLQESNRTRSVTLDIDGKPFTGIVKDIIAGKNHWQLTALVNFVLRERGFADAVNKIKSPEIQEELKTRKFELNALTLGVEGDENPDLLDNKEKQSETRDKDNAYNEKPDSFALTEWGESGRIEFDYLDITNIPENDSWLINIFKWWRLRKYMDEILKDGDGNNREYKINLNPDGGLSGFISYIQEHNLWWAIKEKIDNKEISKPKDLFDFLKWFDYKHGTGWDNEKKKIFTIITKALENYDNTKKEFPENSFWEALVDFAIEAKDYGFDYEKRLEQDLNFGKIVGTANEQTILPLLCDFNGDGKLWVKYFDYQKKKQHQKLWKANYLKTHSDGLPSGRKKEWQKDRESHKLEAKQKKEKGKDIENQWDVWTIFGPQLYDAIQTASDVLDIKIKNGDQKVIDKYGNVSGENAVIFNILSTISVFNTDKKLQAEIDTIKVADCTKAKLLELSKKYTEFQPLFAKAIETINWSSWDLAPDLVDSLIGVERIPNTEYPSLWDQMPKDPFCAIWANNDYVKNFVRESTEEQFVQMKKWVMTIFDNVDISGMMNDAGKLTELHIDKARDVKRREHAIQNSFLKTLFGAISSLSFTPGPDGISLWISIGENGASKDLKRLRSWNTSISWVIWTPILKINVWGEYARQFNYSRVVTANLATLQSSKYLGVDAWVSEVLIWGIPTVTILEWWLDYKSDLKTSIEQMYKQYNDVSKQLFDIKSAKIDDINTPEWLERKLTANRIDLYNKLSKSGDKISKAMVRFLDNNEEFIKTNITQIVNYFKVKNIFAAVKDAKKPSEALDGILNIFQDGLTNAWREMMYERIANKYTLSKIWLWVGISFIANTVPIIYPKISLKIKHWRNSYIPLESQKILDADLIRSWWINKVEDNFMPQPPTVEAYGQYISAIFNIKEYDDKAQWYTNKIETTKTAEWYLKLTYTWSKVEHITDIIDLRVKVKNKVLDNFKVSPDGKSIIIGNVWPIAAYTQSDGLGKRCFLILWWTTAKNTCRIDSKDAEKHMIGNPTEAMAFEKDGYQEWKTDDLQKDIINNLTSTAGTNPDNAKDDVKTFFGENGELLTPIGRTVLWNNCKVGDKLISWTLTITQKKDGSYVVDLEQTPIDKLKITYKQESAYLAYLNDNNNRWPRSPTISVNNLFDYSDNKNIDLKKAEGEIDKLSNDLMNLEQKNYTEYAKFLSEAANPQNGEINDAQLLKAITHLEKILAGQKFTTLTWLLTNGDSFTKSYIVDRCKQVFARETYYSGKTISYILWRHGDAGLNMTGPSKEHLSNNLLSELKTIRNNWMKWLTYENNQRIKNTTPIYQDNPTPDKSLIWYTAFYRSVKGGYENKKFSLTWLGSTSYQQKTDIPASVANDAKTRFIENFKTQNAEVALFAEKMDQQLRAQWITIDLTGNKNTNLFKLLNWDELTIDNWTKKVRLETTAIFYLLWDCCNESIGLAIAGIKIQKPKEGAMPWIRSAEWAAKDKYKVSGGIVWRNLSSSMRVGSYGEEIWLNLSMTRTEKKGSDATTPGMDWQEWDNTWTGFENNDGNSTDNTNTWFTPGP